MFDVVTFGSATMDIFVESDKAHVVNIRGVEGELDLYCLRYGEKVEIDHSAFEIGGGALNTASCFSRLGLKTAAAVKIGQGANSKSVIKRLKEYGVATDFVMRTDEERTGFSIILTSFEGDRTVLAHRGANAKIKKSDINFEAIKQSKLVYIAPLNGDSTKVLDDIVNFARENDVIVGFNAGTSSIKKGYNYMKKILENANVVVLNKEEASMATGIEVRPDTSKEKFSSEIIHPDIKEMFKKLKISDYQVIVITDGNVGAYAYDGKNYYFCPSFDGPVVSTLGAGDAFASTFCGTLGAKGLDIQKALMYASVNSSAVVSEFGATQGLLTFDEIEARLNANPDYKCVKI